jgi:hypothetical protein
MALIGMPIAASVLASLFIYGPSLLVFVSVASLTLGSAAVAIASLLSGVQFQIFATGVTLPDIKGWALKFIFILTFLGTFYTTNMAGSLNLFLAIPQSMGLVLVGVFTSMFVFGMFGLTTTSEGE